MPKTTQQEILEILKTAKIFRSLEEKALKSLANDLEVIQVDSGKVFLREGEIAHSMFLILHGSVEIYSHSDVGDEVSLAILDKGNHFGEQALLPKSRGERDANARTLEESSLVKISKKEFQKAIDFEPEIISYLNKIGKDQIRQKLEATSSAFQSLSIPESFSQWIEQKRYLDGEVVFNEGEIGGNFYFIVSGQAIAFKDENNKEKILTKYEAGSFFGELSLIRNEPRSAAVKADGILDVIHIHTIFIPIADDVNFNSLAE